MVRDTLNYLRSVEVLFRRMFHDTPEGFDDTQVCHGV
jgi:hypothetical protein